MSYLKNENGEIIVDAILTKYGREKLSKQGQLKITKFSLSDDEIDYSLYNTTHPDGEAYYDIAIRELPVLEALPGNDIAMKYLLFTDTQGTLSTISNLRVAYPSVFTTGIPLKNVPYAMSPQLDPQPTNYQAVYYVAELVDTFGANYEFKGVIDPDIGETNQIIKTREDLSGMQEVSQNAQSKVYAVGHSFSFKLLSFPRYARTYTISVTAFGPVSANRYSFTILVPGIYSSENQVVL